MSEATLQSNPETSPDRRHRMAAAERREQLIDVAVEMFASNGFEGTTTKAIAQAAGVTEALIFRHFATKEDLYTAILDFKARNAGMESWMSELQHFCDIRDDRALLRAFITKILDSYRIDPNFQRLLLRAALEGHPLYKLMNERRGLPLFNFFRDYVMVRQREGAFRKGNPAAFVFALVSMPIQYAMSMRLFHVNVFELSAEELADTFSSLILDGMRTDTQTIPQGANK